MQVGRGSLGLPVGPVLVALYRAALRSAVSLARLWYPSVPRSSTATRAAMAVSIPAYVHTQALTQDGHAHTHNKVGRYRRPDQATTAATINFSIPAEVGSSMALWPLTHQPVWRSPGCPQPDRKGKASRGWASGHWASPLSCQQSIRSVQTQLVAWMSDHPDKDGRDRGRFVSGPAPAPGFGSGSGTGTGDGERGGTWTGPGTISYPSTGRPSICHSLSKAVVLSLSKRCLV